MIDETSFKNRVRRRWTAVSKSRFTVPLSILQNPKAHGKDCWLQVRAYPNGVICARYVNVNGKEREIGAPFEIDPPLLDRLVAEAVERIRSSPRQPKDRSHATQDPVTPGHPHRAPE